MRTDEGRLSLPGLRIVQGGLVRIRQGFAAAPMLVKILLVMALVVLAAPLLGIVLVAGLGYAPFALSAAHRSVVASLSVAVWGLVVVSASGLSGDRKLWFVLLLLLPFAVVAAAHAGSLGRWFVPCRTVAWALLWALPVGLITLRLARSQPVIGLAVGWAIAGVVLAWRLAKSWQEEREFGRQQARGGALAAPYGWPPSRGPRAGGPRPLRRCAPSTSRTDRRPRPGPTPRTTAAPGRRRSRWTRPWPSWTT